MSDLTLRRATPDDAELLVRLRYEMQTELEEAEDPGAHAVLWRTSPAEVRDNVRAYFERELKGGHFAGYFVEKDGEVVATGCVVVYDTPPSPSNPSGAEGYIMNMYTVPAWRHHGLARRLLDKLIEHARAEGAGRVWLRASEQGRFVYRKYGFEEPGHYMQMRFPPL
jgi:GNAT superfamily N-acetyltransferase